MSINFEKARSSLAQFSFQKLFVEELGWSAPSSRKSIPFEAHDAAFTRRGVADLAGVAVLEIEAAGGKIPDANTRAAIHKLISKLHHENLLIFVDAERTQSLWYWVKRENGKSHPRDHLYFKGQPGDLFLTKLGQIVFELGDFDNEGNVSVVEVAQRLQKALDVERVTKKFYRDFQDQHVVFLELITGIADDHHRRWYASVLLNRLMFIYFLQKKPPGFLDDGNQNYLADKLEASKQRGPDRFFSEFLSTLFFEGFAKPEKNRSAAAKKLLGNIKYLNGGLFLRHSIEQDYPSIQVPDAAFESLFELFERYTWHLDDTPGGKDDEINPDVLGYIFEKYINQKAFGAYYTRTEITEYLCERTIHQLILDAVNKPESIQAHQALGLEARTYESLGDLLMDLDASLCRRLLHQILPGLSLLDPACGSGAFLVAAMKTLINVYAAIIGRIKFLSDRNLTKWLADVEKTHASVSYFIKKRIITDNLFGVDIMEEATEIARLRLFLALVASAHSIDDLEPLPNIDFNILAGNSLIGLMRVNDADFEKRNAQRNLFRQTYKDVLLEKNRLIENFRHASDYAEDLSSVRDAIDEKKSDAYETLNDILLEEFQGLGIKYERATWDLEKKKEGKSIKRSLKPSDIEALRPFHWGFDFDEIMNKRGGFDAVITNPPWETFQPDAKEFFQGHSAAVSKKNMDIKDFEKELERLLRSPTIMAAWLEYHSKFNYQRSYYRQAPQYRNQVPIIDGKRHGKDVNLYKLFLEQCVSLLRKGGYGGMVLPSGTYTDLGAKQLREMLFSETQITSMIGFENRKEIFEGVHRSFKFIVLTFEKGKRTETFPAAFMRHDLSELESFPKHGSISLSRSLISRLSPNSLSITEVKGEIDLRIIEKLLKAPLLREAVPGGWNVEFHREFNMTEDSYLFHKTPDVGMVPLYEGKMIHQFDAHFSQPRYWIRETDGRIAKLKKNATDVGQTMDYERHRLSYRDVARSTDERTMIAAILPKRVFTGNTLVLATSPTELQDMLCLLAFLNSFTVDYLIRQKVSAHCNMFYVYELPIPRLTEHEEAFAPIVERARRLTWSTPEFNDLQAVGVRHAKMASVTQRGQIRAELDGLVARAYALSEAEFTHILSTFPLVPDPVRIAARNAFRDAERGLIK